MTFDNAPGDATTHEPRGTRFVGGFVPGDPAMRRDFDHQFGAFVRRFREHWHIEALMDALDVIGSHVDRCRVRLQGRPSGTLDVTISFALEPVRAPQRSRDESATSWKSPAPRPDRPNPSVDGTLDPS